MIKDLQKSYALQACRMLVDLDDRAKQSVNFRDRPKFTLSDIQHIVNVARLAVAKKGSAAR